MQDPELQNLAAKLPGTVAQSYADKMVKKYLGAFRRWKTWAMGHGFTPLPEKSSQMALYLQHLGDTTQAKASVEEAFNALAWVRLASGLSSPTLSPFMRATLEGLQRILARPVTEKTPVSIELLARIV